MTGKKFKLLRECYFQPFKDGGSSIYLRPSYLAHMRLLFSVIFIAAFSCSFFVPVSAQKISGADLKKLDLINDSLNKYGSQILDDTIPGNRLRADSMFTRILVRGLRIPFSFYYPFDSMQTAPVVYPDDSSFRIITWHYTINDADFHQRGALQVNTPDGSLKLFPLYDVSDYTDAPQDSVRTAKNWIGAVYYKIIQKTWQGKNVYTLLGYDANRGKTTRKWMEMLSFNQDGEPRWGGSFLINDGSPKPKTVQRYLMEYKRESAAKLNYDADEDLIVMDHLVSESNEPEKKYTLVPSGDYEGFKWTNGLWINQPKLYTENRGDNNEPRPATILNDNGTPDEEKLMEQSEKNMNKGKPAKTEPAKPKPAKKKG